MIQNGPHEGLPHLCPVLFQEPPWATLLTRSFILCAHLSPLHYTFNLSTPNQHILLHSTFSKAPSVGSLHTLPFLLTASDFHQLGVFCLLHGFDIPLRCAVSRQIQEYMPSPMGCVPKVLFILNVVSLKCLLQSSCLEGVFPGLHPHPHR